MKRGQVAIYVVIAMVLVGSIALLFLLSGNDGPTSEAVENFEVSRFIEGCITEQVQEYLGVMMLQGGFVSPQQYVIYGRPVEYICYSPYYYDKCRVTHPFLESEMENELKSKIMAEGCFNELNNLLIQENWVIRNDSFDPDSLKINIEEDRIFVEMKRETTLEKRNNSQTISEFSFIIRHPAGEMIRVAEEISTGESTECLFNKAAYEASYPRFEFDVYTVESSSVVYSIKDKDTGVNLLTAVRSCAVPQNP